MPWLPVAVLVPLSILLGDTIARLSPFYRKLTERKLTENKSPGRQEGLDALRGILALSVLFHHGAWSYGYHQSGEWGLQSSAFYALLGPFAVALFFAITGYLFWSRMVANRLGDLRAFWWGRLWRIGPLYLLAAAVVVVLVCIKSGGTLRVTPLILGRELLKLASLGIVTPMQLNGIDIIPLNAGVIWTLRYEWQFYLVVPVLAWFTLPRRFLLFAAAIALASRRNAELLYYLPFLAGMAAVYLVRHPRLAWLYSWKGSALTFAGILVFLMGMPVKGYRGTLCLLIVFLPIVAGADLWGILRLRGLRVLGTISYSIYLLHGIVLAACTAALLRLAPHSWENPWIWWLAVGVCTVITVAVSSAAYRWVEHPFLRKPLPSWLIRPQ